jgi:L-ascorbate metabolism protein UlaG (beta-lactamase superfamily)
VKITKLVQSTILIEHGDVAVLVDPGAYNPARGIDPARFTRLDGLVITHRHADHFDIEFTQELNARFAPRIVTNPEIALTLGANGLGAQIGRPGDVFEFSGLRITLTHADHQVRGEVIPNFGFVVSDGKSRVYHTSDTSLIESVRLAQPDAEGADAMFVPISNRGVVMGIDDALHMVADFKPSLAIPMHYDSPKDSPRVDPSQFVTRHRELVGKLSGLEQVEVKVLDFEQSLEL